MKRRSFLLSSLGASLASLFSFKAVASTPATPAAPTATPALLDSLEGNMVTLNLSGLHLGDTLAVYALDSIDDKPSPANQLELLRIDEHALLPDKIHLTLKLPAAKLLEFRVRNPGYLPSYAKIALHKDDQNLILGRVKDTFYGGPYV